MPTTLPVPSKGALRALRHLALGTSCTIAAGTALLTEDRRRRIHAARQVYENAQTLKSFKSSRNYHVTIESFEEQALQNGDGAYWLPSKVARSRHIGVVEESVGLEGSKGKPMLRSSRMDKKENIEKPTPPTRFTRSKSSNAFICPPILGSYPHSTFKQRAQQSQVDFMDKNSTPMQNMADLKDKQMEAANLDVAISTFYDALCHINAPRKAGIDANLVDVAIRLCEVAAQQSRIDIQEQLLTTISRHGPIEENQFEKFKPAFVMDRMIRRVRKPAHGKHEVNGDLLKDIASIYLTSFNLKPVTTSSDKMQQIGERLCQETCQAGLYDVTLKVFTRLERQRGERPPCAVQYLIEATQAKRQYGKLFRYFKLLYSQTRPGQVEFFKIGNMVIEPLLDKANFDDLEEFLRIAAHMAGSCSIPISTTWLLKTLGHHWRSYKDIDKTRALFGRLTPFLPSAGHPQALYAAIIQYCIEGGLEPAAMEYHQHLAESYPKFSNDIRILGHFAYAKSLRGDWDGVKSDLQNIHRLQSTSHPSRKDDFGSMFTPIMKVFAKCHHVNEIEQFLQEIVTTCQLQISPYLFNLMVGVYAGSKEIDPLIRWIDFAASLGFKMNPVSINTTLSGFIREWSFSFLEAFRLYHQVKKLDKELGTQSTNATTFLILEKVAISKAPNDDEAMRNLERLKNYRPNDLENDETLTVLEAHERDMLRAYGDARFADVLELYEAAHARQLKIGPQSFLLGVKASLKIDGGSLEGARSLIKTAHDGGQDVSASIALLVGHQMKRLDEEFIGRQEILEIVQDNIKAMKARGIEVTPAVLTNVLNFLVNSGQCQQAIDFWQSASRQFKRSTSELDLVTLTVLLRAYIRLRNNTGIRWATNMLSENNLRPDTRFYTVLTNARTEARRLSIGRNGHASHNYKKCITQACDQVLQMREGLKQEKQYAKYHTIKVVEKAMRNQAASGQLAGSRKEIVTLHRQEMEVKDGRDGWQTFSDNPAPVSRAVGVAAA